MSLAAVAVAAQERVASKACFPHTTEGGSIYSFQELDITERKNISLADYYGKVGKISYIRICFAASLVTVSLRDILKIHVL